MEEAAEPSRQTSEQSHTPVRANPSARSDGEAEVQHVRPVHALQVSCAQAAQVCAPASERQRVPHRWQRSGRSVSCTVRRAVHRDALRSTVLFQANGLHLKRERDRLGLQDHTARCQRM